MRRRGGDYREMLISLRGETIPEKRDGESVRSMLLMRWRGQVQVEKPPLNRVVDHRSLNL